MSNSMRERMGTVVNELVENDEKTAVILADISTNYFQEAFRRYPNRVINLGIMEQTAVSLASGFALEGFHPIVHTITPFLVERPFEQIKDDFCYQGLGGTFISIGASYDYGTDGMTHHGPGDVSILKTLPRMQVCVPGTGDEFETLLRQTYDNGAPTYLRTGIQQNENSQPITFGKLHVVQKGKAGVVIAVGPMLDRVMEAVADLDVTVLYATTISPFDAETLQEAVAEAAPNIVVVEPYYEGGLVQDISQALQELPSRIKAIGVPRQVIRNYGSVEQHDDALGLTAEGIRAKIVQFLEPIWA